MSRIKIPFNDLRRRFVAMRPGLERRFGEVLDGGHYILGENVTRFEAEFAGFIGEGHAVGVASGTDALWLALIGLGIGPGDEVITAGNTCPPTAAGIIKAGATPVLVDVDPATLTMAPAAAEAAFTKKTRALLPVHLYGQCADLGALTPLAKKKGVPLIEDCAQAHGARFDGRIAGSFGAAACFSFYPTKNLGALGDGGLILASDESLADKVRLLRQYGYERPNVSSSLGFNSRLDELQAAFLREALGHLPAANRRRRAIAKKYDDALAGSDLVPVGEAEGRESVYHLYVVRSRDRKSLREKLDEKGIGSAVHYPLPLHKQKGFENLCRIGPGGLTECEKAAAEILSIPLFPELTDDEVTAVIDALRS